MSRVKVLVIRAAGINCDLELVHAFERGGADHVDHVHVRSVAEQPALLDEAAIFAIPGGFSYGDDIAAGRVLAVELQCRLGDALRRFVDRGGLIFGVCNGFQVLVASGLLPGFTKDDGKPTATLTDNDSGFFVDRWCTLETVDSICLWAPPAGTQLELPVAHGEGKLVLAQQHSKQLERDRQVVFRYTPATNPSGAAGGITGITDPTGRILGLMPHPERHVSGLQHPRWTRDGAREAGDGLMIFERGVGAAR